MAVWYELEKNEIGISNFLNSNWGFHDFRIETFEYNYAKDMLTIFLKYDTGKEGVLLKFNTVIESHTFTDDVYEAQWLNGSVIVKTEDDTITWLSDDEWGDNSEEHIDEIKKYTTWVRARSLIWAITDGEGNPIEMPAERIDQIWIDTVNNTRQEYHFNLKPLEGEYNKI